MSTNRIEPWKMEKGVWPMFMGELVGTASLIFIGCMGCIGTLGKEPPPPMQSALTFGLTVNLLIMTYGHVSGAHFNPAVTLGALMLGMKSIPTSIVYMIAQFIGAVLGYGLIKIVTPGFLMSDGSNPSSGVPLCVTAIHPDISIVQAILIEILCTSLILLGACATWDSRCSHTTDSTAIRFGMAVAAISFAASPYTGCSMNPARTFGPALWNSAWENQWVYWVGPMLGGALGTSSYIVLFSEKRASKRRHETNEYGSYKMNEVDSADLDNPASLDCAQ
ncbi:aquaporin AQPAe.a-like isoform X2 [Phymastichus coffea]|uniref:aquaporin AQPAe.a-like isoform X2 n=1 Tax=Phymastichus coffea TaxID=108790 RepID=UPI00273C93AE|nr:aquaporin AQPAe.a-like isoform X2 [Phymastichus coffea]